MMFNDIDFSPYFDITDIRGRGLYGYEIESVERPDGNGAFYKRKKTPPRMIEVDIVVEGDSLEDLRMDIDEINRLLVVDEPKELIFPDEPNMTYYAVPEKSSEDGQVVTISRGTIVFKCDDPYKYGQEITTTFPSDVVSVQNNGTFEADPIFELRVLSPVTFAMIQNQNDHYMMMGNPTQVETTTYERFERVFYTDCESLTGWTTANAGEVDGVIAGTMAVQGGTRFQPSDYGTGANVWHGPAMKTSLPDPVQDFRMQTWISMYNTPSPDLLGRVDVYLLDVNGNIVSRVGMMDGSARTANMYGIARVSTTGDYHTLIYEYGDHRGNWNDFAGVLRIQREGNRWSAYFAMTDTETGRHHTRRSVYWTDYENLYTNQVAQVVVQATQYDSYDVPNALGIYSISVDKINQPTTENETDVPFKVDDLITLDHKDEVLLVNGEERKELKDFGATYFKLARGENQLVVLPTSSFDVTMKYRERNI